MATGSNYFASSAWSADRAADGHPWQRRGRADRLIGTARIGSRETSRELLIRTEQDGSGDVLVAVEDSGPGLQPETRNRLFEPFYTTKPAGMGMGLSISRSIIETHGGRLWAAANMPRGATF
jgi:signal transduction histidine kinase